MNNGILGIPKRYGPLFLYKRWDPYAPDESPHALSCEFDDPDDIGKFTRINIDGVSNLVCDVATTLTKGLYLLLPNNQYRWRTLLRPLPGDAEYSIFLGISPQLFASGGLITGGGLAFSTTAVVDTGSQHSVCVGSLASNHKHRYTLAWQTFGSTATGALSADGGIWDANYVAYRRNGGISYYGWSTNGEDYHWSDVNLGFTPLFFGPYGQNYSGFDQSTGEDMSIAFQYMRYYADGTKRKSGRIVNVYK